MRKERSILGGAANTADPYPITVKMVTLDAADNARIRRATRISEQVRSSLTDMLIDATTQVAQTEDEMWDGLAARFGYGSLAEVLADGKNMKVNYISQELSLQSKEEVKPEADAAGGAPEGK